MTEMPMTSGLDLEDGFRIGGIFGRSFGVLSRNLPSFVLLAVIPALPPVVLTLFPMASHVARPGQTPQLGALMTALALLIAGVLLWLFLSFVAQAIILHGAFQDMRGRPVLFGESAMKGLARFLPVLGVAICVVLTVAFGVILLVFPAFIFMSMYYVALPVCVVERRGPFASMKRSAALTKGHRWKVFGLVVLLAIISSIASLAVSTLFGLSGSALVVAAGTLVWTSLFGAYCAVVVAVLYHDLRVAHDGVDIEQMAAVFD
jgi:hypothetical protein